MIGFTEKRSFFQAKEYGQDWP